jgi:hypothetical protein
MLKLNVSWLKGRRHHTERSQKVVCSECEAARTDAIWFRCRTCGHNSDCKFHKEHLNK